MKVLLFGGTGQLGVEVHKRAIDLNFSVTAPVSSEVNITDRAQVEYLLSRTRPTCIVNCAAYTAVDLAETERDLAFAINACGPQILSEFAREYGAYFIHISTDYVFSGQAKKPYLESDPVGPQSVYGQSKLEGERFIQDNYPKGSAILRTSWLHGKKGPNFVQAMVKLFGEREEVKVVNDQVGCPTWAGWLAEVIIDLIRLEKKPSGILHASCSGSTSWYEFALKVQSLISGVRPELASTRILPQTTEELGRPAPRPAFSVLDCTRLESVLGRKCMRWEVGVREHLKELFGNLD